MTITLPKPATNIIQEAPAGTVPMAGSIASLVISVASVADRIPAWGVDVRTRDLLLRQFWPTEDYFASALFTTIAQYVAFGWTLKGAPRMVKMSQEVMNRVQFGGGWEALMEPFLIDYFTQDNGAFMEIVRTDDDPRAPVVSLNHLDSYRCLRTGQHETPVIYVDMNGRFHKLKWYQVIALTEFPAPIEEGRGIQYCALTRILRTAQTIRDISVVKQEKAAGRFTRQVHLVGGVQRKIIEDAMNQNKMASENEGFVHYVHPVIVASLDPTSRVTKETIDLASVPDDWDEEKALRSYITALSMAFGSDYQNFAPLPGGGLGSSSQSKILNMKSRGKGPGLFMKKVQRVFNFHGILLPNVTLEFGEQDVAEQMERAELSKSRALVREIRIRSGEITTEVARQMALDDGDLDERYLKMMGEDNATEEIMATSTDPAHVPPGPVTRGMPGPKEPPGGSIKRPDNSNAENNRGPANNQKRNPGGTPEGGARA